MPIFQNQAQVTEMFGDLWRKLIKDTEFGSKLKENGITILFRVSDPDTVMYVDENGPLFGADAEAQVPVITMMMSGDTVHKFWLKKVNIPKALALRHIKAKGPVGKVLQLLPLLKPGYEVYPSYCEKYNLPMNF